jgi:hypothetical protein
MEQEHLHNKPTSTETADTLQPPSSQQAVELPALLPDASLSPAQIGKIEEITAPWPRFVYTLRRSNPIRKLAFDVLAGRPLTEVQPVLEALSLTSPRRWRERGAAAWILGQVQLQPEEKASAVEGLCQLLDNQTYTGRRRSIKRPLKRAAQLLYVPTLLGMLITFLFLVITLVNDSPASRSLLDWMLPCVLGTAVYTIVTAPLTISIATAGDRKRNARVRAAAATSLGRMQMPQSVGALARAVLNGSMPVHKAASSALQHVLPTLTPDHYGQLGADAVPSLCRVLPFAEETLALAILDALAKVGDGSAVDSVERLTKRGRTAKVREEATRLLPILQQRQAEENAPKILLRASEQTRPGGDVLLRPASGVSDARSEELLRPSAIEPGIANSLAAGSAPQEFSVRPGNAAVRRSF